MLVASEFADGPTILTIMSLCVLFAALVGRWWTLVLPVVFVGAALAVMPIDWYYERTPEDVQAGVVFGAAGGLFLASVTLLARRYIGRRRSRRSH
jgi:drug/metabolite transporter (DMT)-like permease